MKLINNIKCSKISYLYPYASTKYLIVKTVVDKFLLKHPSYPKQLTIKASKSKKDTYYTKEYFTLALEKLRYRLAYTDVYFKNVLHHSRAEISEVIRELEEFIDKEFG